MIFAKSDIKTDKDCIVYLTTYPPRECGIATFTADLINYTDGLFSDQVHTAVVAMNTMSASPIAYGPKVLFAVEENNKEEYVQAANRLNAMSEVKLICIQHEFGIFGDDYGNNITVFLQTLTKPSIITFHTVLPEPTEEMNSVVKNILQKVTHVVVMTELSKELLVRIYGADPGQIRVIAHGIHPQDYTDGEEAKKRLGLSGKNVLATFGLLSRGKGIEYGIRALPDIVALYPDTVYLVLGATHPVVFAREGEVYRNELLELARALGVEKYVIFHNKYLTLEDLLSFLEATDIYLSLSQNPNQAVSGTLSYALGAGRAVFSTAFMQAKELITEEVGMLLDFNNHEQIVQGVKRLFADTERLKSMGKAAYFRTRAMTWTNVALGYMTLFSEHAPSLVGFKNCLMPVKLDYIKKLTDDFGMLQFAHLGDPDPRWGYTLDDNARALVALCWHGETHRTPEVYALMETYLGFIERSAQLHTDRFVNYFTEEHQEHDDLNNTENLEDANARALWALSEMCKSAAPEMLIERAKTLFIERSAEHRNVISPRAAALYIKAFANAGEGEGSRERIGMYADFLVDLYDRTVDGGWQWFEESLTYSNGLLPEALLIAYRATGIERYREVGKITLDFLLRQSFEGTICVPVGQGGWYKKGGEKQRHDQQPEEVSALILALRMMMLCSDDSVYSERIALAFNWFLGNNLLGQFVYTHSTGGCYDGIGEYAINLNQGAESTVSYLLARLAMDK